MASAVTASVDLSALQEGSVQMVKRLYGLNPSDFDGCLLYYPQTNMEAEELLLLKLRDTSQQEAVPRRRGGPARNAEDQLRRLRPGAV